MVLNKLGNFGVITREPVAFSLPFCRRQECSAENVA